MGQNQNSVSLRFHGWCLELGYHGSLMFIKVMFYAELCIISGFSTTDSSHALYHQSTQTISFIKPLLLSTCLLFLVCFDYYPNLLAVFFFFCLAPLFCRISFYRKFKYFFYHRVIYKFVICLVKMFICVIKKPTLFCIIYRYIQKPSLLIQR